MMQQNILAVDWVVVEDAPALQVDAAATIVVPVAAPVIRNDVAMNNTSSPWAKHMLVGALALSVIGLAGLAVILVNDALFADVIIRSGWAIGGIPIITMLAIAMFADPYRNVGDEMYRAFTPVGPCTPSRDATLTGRR